MISWVNLRGPDADWTRPGPNRHDLRIDVRYTAGLLAMGVVMVSTAHAIGMHPYGSDAALPLQLLMIIAAALPLALRRVAPELVVVWEAIALVVVQYAGLSDGFSINVYVFVAFFTLGAWGRNRARAVAVRLLIMAVMFVWLLTGLIVAFGNPGTLPGAPGLGPIPPFAAAAAYSLVSNIAYFAGAYFFGNAAWLSARREARLREQAEELRAERERTAAAAVLGERVRIARELHDVVAHSVSLMGVQAAAARRSLDRDPDVASAALRAVEDTARNTVGELGGLLGMLRSGDAPPERVVAPPAPGVNGLPELADLARETGLAVAWTVVGRPVPLSESVSLSLYRVAQEALTNTVKHARASRADLRLRYLPDAVEVEVVDDGLPALPTSAGSGLGQLGMHERVALHDGELEHGPRAGQRGYRVRARIPLAPTGDAVAAGTTNR